MTSANRDRPVKLAVANAAVEDHVVVVGQDRAVEPSDALQGEGHLVHPPKRYFRFLGPIRGGGLDAGASKRVPAARGHSLSVQAFLSDSYSTKRSVRFLTQKASVRFTHRQKL